MAGWQVNPFVLPDFGQSAIDGRQAQQQQAMNSLLMAQRQREYGNQQQFENALSPSVLAALNSPDPAIRQQAMTSVASSGIQGFQAMAPMMRDEREAAEFRSIMGGRGAPMPQQEMPQQGAPQARPAAMPQMPGNLAPILQQASAESGVPIPMILATLAQESSMGRDPRATANGGGIAQIISSTARDPGYGLPPISAEDRLKPEIAIPWAAKYMAARAKAMGVTDFADPAQRAKVFGAYNGGGDPNYAQNVERRMTGGEAGGGGDAAPRGAAPAPSNLPTLEALSGYAQSGNKRAMEYASRMLPFVQAASPEYVRSEEAGRIVFRSKRNPNQVLDVGPANDVRPETRNGIRGQVINGKFEPINDPAPAGYRTREDSTQEPVPGGPAVNNNQQQDFGNTRHLREEFNGSQAVKDYAILRPNMLAIRKAEGTNTRAADIDMVFAFAKMLDPNSVVREGEQITLSKTGGVWDTVQGWVDGLTGGGRLTPDVRAGIARQAEGRFNIAADAYNERLEYYQGVARDNGFKPEHIGREATGRKPEAAPAAPGAAAAPLPRPTTPAEAQALKPGTRFLDPNGVERVR